MFRSIARLVDSGARVAVAPVSVALELTNAVVAPVADAVDQVVEGVQHATDGGRPANGVRGSLRAK